MKIKALCSFAGVVSMAKGEIRDCENMDVVNDLLESRYVEKVKTGTAILVNVQHSEETLPEKKPHKRTVKKDENQ